MPKKNRAPKELSPSEVVRRESSAIELFDSLITDHLDDELPKEEFKRFFRLARRGATWNDIFEFLDAEIKLLKNEHLSRAQQTEEIQKVLCQHIELRPAILDRHLSESSS